MSMLRSDVVIKTIQDHIPSLTDRDEHAIVAAILDDESEVADLAQRTCRCGLHIDGFYSYVDHLIAVFGGESHIGG